MAAATRLMTSVPHGLARDARLNGMEARRGLWVQPKPSPDQSGGTRQHFAVVRGFQSHHRL